MPNIVNAAACSVSAVPRIPASEFRYVTDCDVPEAPELLPTCPESFFNAAFLGAQATATAVAIGTRVATVAATTVATQIAITTATTIATTVATNVVNQYFDDLNSSSGSSYCQNGDEHIVKLTEPFFFCHGDGYAAAVKCSRDDTEDEAKECPWYSPVSPEQEFDDVRMDLCLGGMFFEDDVVRIRRIDCHWQILSESRKIVKGKLTTTLVRRGTGTAKVWTINHGDGDLDDEINVALDICDTGVVPAGTTLPVGCQITMAWTYQGWTIEGFDCDLET